MLHSTGVTFKSASVHLPAIIYNFFSSFFNSLHCNIVIINKFSRRNIQARCFSEKSLNSKLTSSLRFFYYLLFISEDLSRKNKFRTSEKSRVEQESLLNHNKAKNLCTNESLQLFSTLLNTCTK